MKYELNVPAIKLARRFGDDPELAARGVTSTGAPGLVNSVIVTASGLLFGAGRDNALRARPGLPLGWIVYAAPLK